MKYTKYIWSALGAATMLAACQSPDNAGQQNSTSRSDVQIEAQIDKLVAQMTIEEKIGQINQINGAGWASPDIVGRRFP